MKSEGICEMCGHHVALRQKAHIIAENAKRADSILMLCPTCHIMFDTHVKPKVFKAVREAGFDGLPESWKNSIYEQAAEASLVARSRKFTEAGATSHGGPPEHLGDSGAGGGPPSVS